MTEASYEDFLKIDVRVGRIIEINEYKEARSPSYIFLVDFGPEIGRKKSIAQLPPNYSLEDLQDRLVACVINFPPRQIGIRKSEVLTLGFPDENNNALLVAVDDNAVLGGRLF